MAKTRSELLKELAELRRSEARYRVLVEQMSDGYVLTRYDRVLYANPAMAAMLKCKVEDLLGRSWTEFVEPELADYVRQTPMEELPPLLDAEVRRADGVKRTVECAIRSASYQGELAEFVLVRDITERKQTERALQRRVAELEALRKACIRLTTHLELQPVLEALLEQVLHLSDADDAHIFLYDGRQLTFGTSRFGQGPQQKCVSAPRLDGFTHTVVHTGKKLVVPDVGAHPLFANRSWGGAIAGLPLRVGERRVGVLNIIFKQPHTFSPNELDLMELFATQAAIAIDNARLIETWKQQTAFLERQVAKRTEQLAEANTRLQEAAKLRSKLITDISHELRLPLTNVRLGLELLEEGEPEKQGEYLAIVQAHSDRLIGLVEDILRFSELEQETTPFAPVELNALVEQVVIAYRPRAVARGLELVFDPDPALPSIYGHSQQLVRLVTELVDNAIAYTEDGGVRVSTHLAPQAEHVQLSVHDTGIGIEPEELAFVFDPFFRGYKVGCSRIPGAGMGLSIAKEITGLHNGTICAESQVGQGSTFTVCLPVDSESQVTGQGKR